KVSLRDNALKIQNCPHEIADIFKIIFRPRRPCTAAANIGGGNAVGTLSALDVVSRRGTPAKSLQSIIAYFYFFPKMQNCQLSLILPA
ncbi:MAG: hypothetical protein IIT98_05870, partial [Kiritimatiellae bacterium]|nr:hypothetical protein [Kiritimatiellia bacterium]